MRLGLIGNPENRRVGLFLEACRHAGVPSPRVLAWEELCREPESIEELTRDIDLLRIESPGENELVTRQLIRLGGGPKEAVLEHGEIGYLAEFHLGFCKVLDGIASRSVRCMNPPADIQTMFDKWACHLRFAEAGLRRPRSQMAPRSLEEFKESMAYYGRAFLKPLHGSSASGVCAYRWNREREQLIAPIRLDQGTGKLYNSLRVQTYSNAAAIDAILALLLPQGMIQEEWISKARIENERADLRIVVIRGEPRHVVVRLGRQPMTNLHLGNRRGDLKSLEAVFGEGAVQDCMESAQRAAACFPTSLCAGVDILLNEQGVPLVGEINAFGDLLPGLTHRGESIYEAILSSLSVDAISVNASRGSC